MKTTTHSTACVLNGLIETCKDGQHGFFTASEDVKNAGLKELFWKLSQERGQFVHELQDALRNLDPEENEEEHGTVAGALHRGWIDLKSVLARGDEHAVLAECERGEDAAVQAYEEALAHEDMPLPVRTLVQHQYYTVKAAHDRVRDLRNSYEE